MDLSNIGNHYIICGWKLAMNKILSEIMTNNPALTLKRILIIANIEPDSIELFRQQYPDYQDITILRGEHYNEALLRKANIIKAEKVLILADESVPASPTEVDSKTIMTAMAIRSISVNIRICAELLDSKFSKYLETAHVEEIIYTNEYSKALIANTFSHVGLAKVVNELLDIHTNSFITTKKIPDSFIGKNFRELKNYFQEKDQSIMIGLLENVGSYLERKNEAIRDAQKTADVNKLIQNLKSAKSLESNKPNINPDEAYIVPGHAMAILVGKR